MLPPAVGHMGCLVQPWLPARLPSIPPVRSLCLLPLTCLAPFHDRAVGASEGSGNCLSFCHCIGSDFLLPAHFLCCAAGIFPLGSLGGGGAPTARLAALSDGLLGKVTETIEPLRCF